VLARAGFAHELRAAFVSDQSCWGGVTLLRHEDSHDFTEAEGRLLARLSAPLAEGFKQAMVVDRSGVIVNGEGPGLIVLGEQHSVQAMNGAAQVWLAELIEPGQTVNPARLPAPIYEVALRAQALARATAAGMLTQPLQAHLRLRTRAGQWLMLHGSHMVNLNNGSSSNTGSNTGQTAIILEVAQSSEIAQLLMLVYDLTPREREALQLVLKGLVAKEMALALQVSVYTVQDYLKALFSKVGVHSRAELVAKVLGDHYFPQVGVR
jgi:DNA-binding CsgD family transcriptional regulator